MRELGFPGDKLAARREALGMTLQDAYAEVHVPLEYLRALEEGRMDGLPPAAYTLGFIQTYCAMLELRPEPFIDRYRMLTQVAAPEPEVEAAPVRRATRTVPAFRMPRLMPDGPAPAWMQDAITWGAICGILLLGWATWSTLVSPLAGDEDTRVNAGQIEAEFPPPSYPEYHFEDDGY